MKKQFITKLFTTILCMSLLVGCGTDISQDEILTDDNNTTKATIDDTNTLVESVDTTKVFVSPEWVKSVIDGNQEESSDYVILECSWGTESDSPSYKDGHIQSAYHINTDDIEDEAFWNLKTPEEIERGQNGNERAKIPVTSCTMNVNRVGM